MAVLHPVEEILQVHGVETLLGGLTHLRERRDLDVSQAGRLLRAALEPGLRKQDSPVGSYVRDYFPEA